MSSVSFKRFVFAFCVLNLFGTLKSQTIDLNKRDIYIRRGFDQSWTEGLPVDNENWKHIAGNPETRPLVIRELGLDNLPERTTLSLRTYPAESFTFVTSFDLTKEDYESQRSLSLYWRGVGYGWEVFVNGTSIAKEFNENSDGSFSPRRGHQLIMPIPPNTLKKGNNILAYHIKGDPTFYGTGFYYGKSYFITPTDTLYPRGIKFFSISHFAVYIVIALAWAYLYLRQPQHILYLRFSLLAVVFALYNAVKAMVEIGTGAYKFISFRIEYFSIFCIALLFALVINTFLKHKITKATFSYAVICGIMAFFTIWASPNFLFDLLRLWQYTLPFMAAYVFYLSVVGLIKNNKASRDKEPIKDEWIRMTKLESVILALSTSVLLVTVLADAIDSLTLRYGIYTNRIGFLISMCSMAGLLFNKYINASQRVEKWSESLEQEVEHRTTDLKKAKDDMEAILSTSGDGIVRLTLNLRLVSYNKAYKDLVGYSDKELESLDLSAFYEPEDLQAVLLNRKRVLKNGTAFFRTKAIHKNGEYIYLAVTGSAMYDKEGKPYGIVVNLKNITQEIEAEEKLFKTIEKLEEQRKQLRDLSRQLLHVQEEERKHLSHELHDEVGQAMTAININLESIRTGENDIESLKARIVGCQELVEETNNKIHQFSQELRPPVLDDLGLVSTLRSHSKNLLNTSGLEVTVAGDESVELLSSEIKTVLYRIYLETINNTIKHANASMMEISLERQNGRIKYSMIDNGQGFDRKEVAEQGDGLGLLGMEERILALGGKMNIETEEGKGTSIIIDIPFTE